MKNTVIAIFVVTSFCLVGCDNPSIKGNAFIVKGGGDIKPAAGQKVYLIPEESESTLFSRAIEDVTQDVVESYNTTIKTMCTPAQKAIDSLGKTIHSEINNLTDSGDIPTSGCSLLQKDLSRLENDLKDVKSKHLEKVADIKSELNDLKSKRDKTIQKQADDLKKATLKKLTTSISSEYGERDVLNKIYKVTIKNSTDYYIKKTLDIEVYSKGIKLADSRCGGENLRDEFGFDMDYHFAPQSIKSSCSYRAEDIRDPKQKLFASDNKLPVNDYTGYSAHIIPDEAIVKDAIFSYAPVKNKIGNDIKYTSQEVSFYKILSQKKYPEDEKIASLEISLAKENKAYEANTTYNDYVLTKLKTDKCNNALSTLEIVKKREASLGQIAAEIDKCINGGIDPRKTSQALKDLGKITGESTNIPDVKRLINSVAVKQVINILTNESAMNADTTINGLYTFNKIPKGNYLLYSEYHDSFVNGFWLTPITVKEDAQFDLNNNTFKDESFTSYLERSIDNFPK